MLRPLFEFPDQANEQAAPNIPLDPRIPNLVTPTIASFKMSSEIILVTPCQYKPSGRRTSEITIPGSESGCDLSIITFYTLSKIDFGVYFFSTPLSKENISNP